MVHPLIAFLLLAAQADVPPPTEAVAVETQTQTEVAVEAGIAVDAEAQEPEERLICRTIRTRSERVGERFRKREVCQTQEEWDEERRARR